MSAAVSAFFGLTNAIVTGFLIYGLARGELADPGYVVVASLCAFTAVVHAVRLALLARFPFVTVHAQNIIQGKQGGGES